MVQVVQSIVGSLSALAAYYYHENDLSNITVTLCNNCPDFKDIFIHFFFPELDVDSIVSIDREVADEKEKKCRVDIVIKTENDGRYLIEVKIFDKNQHFCDYIAAYDVGSDHLGYIVNYEWIQPGFEVKHWNDLYKCFKKHLPEINDPVSASMITGYMEYLKSVCSIIDIDKPMKLDSIKSLHHFFDVAKAKLTIQKDCYSVIANKIFNPTSGLNLAPYTYMSFTITFRDKRKAQIFGYIFIYHGADYDTQVYIGVDPTNRYVESRLADEHFMKQGKFYKKPELSNNDGWYNWNLLWFELSKIDELLSCDNIERQEYIIGSFISEVIDHIVM